MEVHEIRYFLAAARELNFTKAARACNVTQPALTRAIQKLEQELGGDLFNRGSGGVKLTELGETLLPMLSTVEQSLQGILAKAHALSLQSEPLTIGVMCTVPPATVVDAIGAVRQCWPTLPVLVRDARAEDIVRLVQDGQVDIGISAWPHYPNNIETKVLRSERYVVIVSADCELRPGEAATREWVSGQPYLQRLNCEFDDFYEAKHGDLPFEVRVKFACEREDWIQSLVFSGHGVAIVPETMPLLSGIRRCRLIDPEVTREVALITRHDAVLSEAALEFIRLVQGAQAVP